MDFEHLTIKAFHQVWSALHFPDESSHSGLKIWELFKNKANTSFQKTIFEDFEKNKKVSIANAVATEMQNLIVNFDLKDKIIALIEQGINDSKIEMPILQIAPSAVLSTYSPSYIDFSSGSDTTRAIGGLIFLAGIFLTMVSQGHAIFYGAILVGLVKMITGR
jgi:hypothetical protein